MIYFKILISLFLLFSGLSFAEATYDLPGSGTEQFEGADAHAQAAMDFFLGTVLPIVVVAGAAYTGFSAWKNRDGEQMAAIVRGIQGTLIVLASLAFAIFAVDNYSSFF